MKFYKRFPGDIMKKTSGLTMAQFGAYDRLIDWCYANEKPVDPEEVYTITHAQTPADRRDVDRVLAKFFTLEADGYRQQRIEEEIADALPRIQAARENGKRGGRPIKTQQKPTGLSNGTQDEPGAKAIQEPDTSSPTSKKKRAAPSAPRPDDVDPQVWADWVDLRTKKRTTASATAVDGARAEAAKAGMTLEAFLRVWCARGSQGLQADWLKPHERPAAPKSFAQADYDAKVDRINRLTGGLAGAKPVPPDYIDMEPANGPATAIR